MSVQRNFWVAFPVYNNGGQLKQFLDDAVALGTLLPTNYSLTCIAVDDGSADHDTRDILKSYRYAAKKILRHEKNQGVVVALLSALRYVAQRCMENDCVAWLDSDGEHNPYDLLAALNQTGGGWCDLALTQICYQDHHLSPLDRRFNEFMGALQGEMLMGPQQYFLHNCPGCWVMRCSWLAQLIPIFEEYTRFFKRKTGGSMRWGEDMTVLAILKHLGGRIDASLVTLSKIAAPNRSPQKIIEQAYNNITHLKLYEEFFKDVRKAT